MTWSLLARYKETSAYPSRAETECQCSGAASPFLETPEFLWKLKSDWHPQDGVPIASVIVDAASVIGNSAFVRPREHGLKRRRIMTGATLAGSTEWTAWELSLAGARAIIGAQVKVDTANQALPVRRVTSPGYSERSTRFCLCRSSHLFVTLARLRLTVSPFTPGCLSSGPYRPRARGSFPKLTLTFLSRMRGDSSTFHGWPLKVSCCIRFHHRSSRE